MASDGQSKRWWRGVGRALAQGVPWVQGGYYIGGGLWSLLSIETFMRLTGPKTDIWLVKALGLLLLVSGVVVIVSILRRQLSKEIMLLAAGDAAVLVGIELVYVVNRTIRPIYLLDALIETVFILGWILQASRANR